MDPRLIPSLLVIGQMAMDNPYGVKAVSEKEAALMRAYVPTCVAYIEACQDVPEVGGGLLILSDV